MKPTRKLRIFTRTSHDYPLDDVESTVTSVFQTCHFTEWTVNDILTASNPIARYVYYVYAYSINCDDTYEHVEKLFRFIRVCEEDGLTVEIDSIEVPRK